jgi:hypothetical protein
MKEVRQWVCRMPSSDALPRNSPPEHEPLLTEKRELEARIRELEAKARSLESHGVAGRIHVAEATWLALRERFTFEPRGEIEIKSIGRVQAWLLTGLREYPAMLSPPPNLSPGTGGTD